MQNKTHDAESETKFDLDKVEIPTPSVDEKEPLSHDPSEHAEPEETSATEKPTSLKKTYRLLSLLLATLLITFSILWATKVIRLPWMDHEANSSAFNELYSKIGPIRVNSEKARLSLTLTVKCSSLVSKENVTRMDKIIKERLVSFLSAPYIYQIISDRDYTRLKIKMRSIINEVLGDKTIEEVYLAEIMMY